MTGTVMAARPDDADAYRASCAFSVPLNWNLKNSSGASYNSPSLSAGQTSSAAANCSELFWRQE